MTPLALCAVLGAASWPTPDAAVLTPADAVRVAAADLRRVAATDPARAFQTRYLSAHNFPPAEREEIYAVASYWVNSLSREALLAKPRRVTPWLFAVVLDDYAWKRERFGSLIFAKGAVEPYFHVQSLDAKGATVPAGAPWLPAADLAYLIATTGSETPIVRVDWFLNRTGIQEGRDGYGYLNFLEIPSRRDAEDLAGLDRKKAEARRRELAAVVESSGVALQGRQLFRFDTIGGVWWESRDVKAESNGRGDKNAARNLFGDYKHDAEEIVAELPNRLPFYYLSDAAGKGIASAPPDIAADSKSPSNDKRVHVGMSCVRCHTRAGLIAFDDLYRRQFSAERLQALDPALQRRIRAAYSEEIVEPWEGDVTKFGRAITRASGMTPAGLSEAYSRQWSRYLDEPVDVSRAAAETGFDPAEFVKRIDAYAKRTAVNDPVLLLFVGREPRSMRRENFEELYGLLMLALGEK